MVAESVRWVESTAQAFKHSAGSIDATTAMQCRRRLSGFVPDQAVEARHGDLRHSVTFWAEFFEALAGLLERRHVISSAPAVAPALVLVSRQLGGVCQEYLRKLEERFSRHEVFEPHRSHYSRALGALRDAALGFSGGAELQRNLVLGLLGHGLLEALDEHVLELEEIALVLNPLLVGIPWRQEFDRHERRSVRPLIPYGESKSAQDRFAGAPRGRMQPFQHRDCCGARRGLCGWTGYRPSPA